MTRRCLKELVEKQFPVNIQTKSKLVLRDMDLLQELEEIEVGFTITAEDERVAKLFEPRATPVKERLRALENIHSLGIKTFAFVGPLLPGNPEKGIAIIGSDAAYLFSSFRTDIPSAIITDMIAWMKTYDKIRAKASSIDLIFPGHDVALLEDYPKVAEDVSQLV